MRRRVLMLMVAALVLIGAWAGPAGAAPGDPTGAPNEGTDLTLGEKLDAANTEWLQAQAVLDTSKKRQAELTAQMDSMQKELEPVRASVNVIAAAAYRTGGNVRLTAALVNTGSAEQFMDRVLLVNTIAQYNDRQIARLTKLEKELADAKKAADDEVAKQQAQAVIQAKKKADAEAALAKMKGKADGYVSVNSPLATPAPRNADGSWPAENCIIDDPTTTGCITPRLLHAAQEARKAGFTHFYSCFRPSGPYEHPKGRACDFAAASDGFGGVASGADKTYGTNLAAFFVKNASSLGVLYVIWFRQVWTPAAGWHAYSGGNGDPSSDHTNHVHLSVL
ncbi:coiled-coil domain-containing protein [Dactylosporangium sp. McL0621]|jgi:peptidoglycan hydrolase CwlO-like protein|uniref:coiled-coil domain-containing protein n=1 Tax=Dactylosporangium sp. McL0621 TaxID=3415678 RepID=UPI003CEF2B92